ncbi:hypothetical protein CDAR_521431 [Caerostris darwini]|uniref:Uncharacterized protein n=1 Tax=Caerostris darwini TaxID=1538125 RepID=A0AAV4MDI8_9ARAC|nr:hypothetical protein CDAR_521431 [Caerostris darwini]
MLKTFVANRGDTNQEFYCHEQLKHVLSEENPADLISCVLFIDLLYNSKQSVEKHFGHLTSEEIQQSELIL